jgi:hypothetical protein
VREERVAAVVVVGSAVEERAGLASAFDERALGNERGDECEEEEERGQGAGAPGFAAVG